MRTAANHERFQEVVQVHIMPPALEFFAQLIEGELDPSHAVQIDAV